MVDYLAVNASHPCRIGQGDVLLILNLAVNASHPCRIGQGDALLILYLAVNASHPCRIGQGDALSVSDTVGCLLGSQSPVIHVG